MKIYLLIVLASLAVNASGATHFVSSIHGLSDGTGTRNQPSVFENNTILRVLPKNSVTDVVFTFKESGNIIRNNIFVLSSKRQALSTNGTEVTGRNNYAGQKRQNNIYFSIDGSQNDPCGLPLADGEKIADPRFVDYDRQDYHLRPGSPAIDAGINNGTATDFDGKKVPIGKNPDIGAFEFGK